MISFRIHSVFFPMILICCCSFFLLSFPTLLHIRLYGHDTIFSAFPGHVWANQALIADAYPTWFTAPRYGIPSMSLQFAPLFYNPLSLVLAWLHIDYTVEYLPYSFLLWRMIGFTGAFSLSRAVGFRDLYPLIMATIYISSGSVASNDHEYVFFVGVSLLPWVATGLQYFLTCNFSFGFFTLVTSSVIFLYCGATNMWMTLPIFTIPYLFFYIVNIQSLKKYLLRFFVLLFSFLTIILLASPLIVTSIAIPTFGNSYRFPISPKEGLNQFNSLYSLFLVNPFYLDQLGANFSSSYYVSLISLLGFFTLFIYRISSILRYERHITIVLYWLNRAYVFPLVTFVAWALLISGYLYAFFSLTSLCIFAFLSSICANTVVNKNPTAFPKALKHSTAASTLPLFFVGIFGLIFSIDNPLNDIARSVFFNMNLVRWQAINGAWFGLSVSILGTGVAYEYFTLNSKVKYLFRLNEGSISAIISCCSLLSFWFIHEILFQSYLDKEFWIGASHLLIFSLIALILLVITIYVIIADPRISVRDLLFFPLFIVFVVVYVTMRVGLISDLHVMLRGSRAVFVALDLIHFVIIIFMFRFRHSFSSDKTLALTLILLADCALASTRLASHLEANSVQRESETPILSSTLLSRREFVGSEKGIFTFPDINPSMWYLTGTMPTIQELDSSLGKPSIFTRLITVVPEYLPVIVNNNLRIDNNVLASNSNIIICPNATSLNYHLVKHIGNISNVYIKSDCPVTVIWLDSWAPGWWAYINGQRHPMYRVNGALRAVLVQPLDGIIYTYFSLLSGDLYYQAFENLAVLASK